MWVAKLEWDPGHHIEVATARSTFNSYKAKGFLARRTGSEEALDPQRFDPTRGSVEFHTRPTLYDKMMEDDDDADAG